MNKVESSGEEQNEAGRSGESGESMLVSTPSESRVWELGRTEEKGESLVGEGGGWNLGVRVRAWELR